MRALVVVALVTACGGSEPTPTRSAGPAHPAPAAQTAPADAGVAPDAFVFASLTGTGHVDTKFDEPAPKDKQIIRRHIHEHHDELRACVEQAQSVNPSFEGTITIAFTIGLDGHVTRAVASGGDANLGACLESTFKQIEFPKPRGGTVEVSYPVVVRAK